MSISGDIIAVVNRLKRADVPLTNLCYQVDEEEWQSLCRYLESVSVHQNIDLTYIDGLTFYGIEVRKRAEKRTNHVGP